MRKTASEWEMAFSVSEPMKLYPPGFMLIFR